MKTIQRTFKGQHGLYDLEIVFDTAGQEVAIYSITSGPSLESWLIDEEEIIPQIIEVCRAEGGENG